jgi:hypothetical protein
MSYFVPVDTIQPPFELRYNQIPLYKTKSGRTFNFYSGHLHVVDRCGHDRMVVWIKNYLCNQCLSPLCEFESRVGQVYSVQLYLIKIVIDLRQVGGFTQVLRFPPPIKLTATI